MFTPSSRHPGKQALLSQQDIEFVLDLAESCGRLAAQMRESVNISEKDDPGDLVTDADLALSKILLKELSQRFPADMLVSEEGDPSELASPRKAQRTWYIDPIDGTDNYVNQDGQYAVMLGLLVDGKAHFGCVQSPAKSLTYFGGPDYGCWRRNAGDSGSSRAIKAKPPGEKIDLPVRLMIGYRDRRRSPWVEELPDLKLVSAGSVGLKVARILEDEADLFIHLSGKLKYWDTVGPVAIALAANLEACDIEKGELEFPENEYRHLHTVLIGRPGSLSWAEAQIASRLKAQE